MERCSLQKTPTERIIILTKEVEKREQEIVPSRSTLEEEKFKEQRVLVKEHSQGLFSDKTRCPGKSVNPRR